MVKTKKMKLLYFAYKIMKPHEEEQKTVARLKSDRNREKLLKKNV